MKTDVRLIINQRLTTNGIATGPADMTGDYSSSVTDFFIKPLPNELYRIVSMTLYLEDEMITDSSHYGGLGNPLTNGLKFLIEDDVGLVKDFTPVNPIKCNGELFGSGGRTSIISFIGNNVDTLISQFGPFVLDLDGGTGQKLIFRLEDDFTGLNVQRINIFGQIEKRNI